MRIRYGHLKKRGTKWYIIYREDGRQKWISTGCTRRDDAEKFRTEQMRIVNARDKESELRHQADLLANERNNHKTMAIQIESVWKLFSESTFRRETAAATLSIYERMWEKFAEWLQTTNPKIQNVYQITDTIVEDYFRHLSQSVGNSTYNVHARILTYIFRTLGKRTKLENHFERIPRKRHTAESRRELTADELKLILDTTDGWIHRLIMIGIYTGLRLGDCCNLRWSEIKGNLIVLKPRKTRQTNKTIHVPIHPELLKMLDALPRKTEYVHPAAAEEYRTRYIQLHLQKIFSKIEGHNRTPNRDETVKRKITLVSFHSLRHTFVSICKNAGVPDAVVMSIVGHGNSAMTRHYTHIGDESARAAIAKIPTIGQEQTAKRELTAFEIMQLVQEMTPDTWQEIRRTIIGE